MRWTSLLLVTILISTSASASPSSTKAVISCSNSSLDSLPDNWSIPDQSCLRIDLGEQEPGSTMFFEISSNSEVDILVFPSNTVSVYQSEQSYRLDSVWVTESVFESFNGNGEWHWEIPTDRAQTRWYLVVDNLAHPQDSGKGSQGGQSVEITLDAGVIEPKEFTLSDSIHRLGPGEFSVVHGPFSVDEGTFVEIHARTMDGFPDIFVMTETAFSYYSPSSNWSSSLRIASADMLLVTNERYLPWEARDTDNEDLYIVVDNRPGPGGGGSGASSAAVTVTVTLTPLLDPTISSETDLAYVDVGSKVTLSASKTPNKSNQIQDSGFSWDIGDDGVIEGNGEEIDHTWEMPGNYSVRLSATSTDSRSASVSRSVRVMDLSDPTVSMGSSGQITKGFGEQLEISATFSDNWGVESLDWKLDGEVVWSNYSLIEPISTLILNISNEYSAGEHVISVVVVDFSGRSTQEDVIVNFIDVTAPVISEFETSKEVIKGQPTILRIFAQDDESENIEYTWTLEIGTENEMQFSGPEMTQVIYEFNNEGPQNVVCRVENEAGLASFAEILVIVKEDESEGGMGLLTIAILLILILLVVAAAAFLTFNKLVESRMTELSESEEEEGKQTPESSPVQSSSQSWSGESFSPFQPTNTQSQSQMWSGESQSPFQSITQDQTQFEPDPDLIGLLRDEETALDPLEGIEDESIPAEGPTESDNLGENHPDRGVRKECQSCSKMFEIDLPEGVDAAYTNCPYCGSEELVSLND